MEPNLSDRLVRERRTWQAQAQGQAQAEPGKYKLVAILLHLLLLNPYSQASPYDASLAK